jgi:hypothetical protein
MELKRIFPEQMGVKWWIGEKSARYNYFGPL